MLKGVSIYTIAGFFGAGINFLVMPLLSHYLLPEEYGILSIYNTYVSILMPLIGIMAIALLNVEYYRMRSKEKFASLFSSIQIIPVIPAIIFLVTFALLPESVTSWLMLPKGVSKIWIFLSVIISVLVIYNESLLNLFIIQKKPGLFAVANILKVLLEVSLTLFFVIYCRMGWKGRVLSWFVTVLVYTVIAFFYFYKKQLLTFNIRAHYIVRGIKFGSPLILHALGSMIINQSDRIFIAIYISPREAGIYSIGYLFGTVLLIATTAFNYFFTPFLYERLTAITEKKKMEIVRVGYIALGCMVVLLILVSFVAPVIFTYLIDKNYIEGTKYVFWTGLSYLFWAVFTFFSGFIYFNKKTSILSYLSVINISLNIILNFSLIPVYGAIGASYATCISFFVNAVLISYFASKYCNLPWFSFFKLKFGKLN